MSLLDNEHLRRSEKKADASVLNIANHVKTKCMTAKFNENKYTSNIPGYGRIFDTVFNQEYFRTQPIDVLFPEYRLATQKEVNKAYPKLPVELTPVLLEPYNKVGFIGSITEGAMINRAMEQCRNSRGVANSCKFMEISK